MVKKKEGRNNKKLILIIGIIIAVLIVLSIFYINWKITGNAVVTKTSSAPLKANLGDKIQLKCYYNSPYLIGCPSAYHGTQQCTYSYLEGKTYVFDCFAKVSGKIPNFCTSGCTNKVYLQIGITDVKCTPNCVGKKCGDNGCGGSCGSCSSYKEEYCDNNKCVRSYCTDSDAIEPSSQYPRGNNPYLKGTAVSLNKGGLINLNDFCEDDQRLLERYCIVNKNRLGYSSYSISSRTQFCTYGCNTDLSACNK